MKPERPTVAVFSYGFLTASMTFTYRQLTGVERRFRPIVFTTRRENEELFPFDAVHECGLHPVRRVLGNALYNTSGRVAALTRRQRRVWATVAQREDVRLIHAHFGTAGIQALPLAKALGLPLLVTFHGYDASKALRFDAYRRSLEKLFEYAEVITVSRDMATRLIDCGADPARMRVLHCGIPVHEFQMLTRKAISAKVAAEEPIQFLQVASFALKKGHRYTFEAFAQHLKRHPKNRLTLIGDGGERRALERLARDLGIREQVEFAGWVAPSEVAGYLQRADVFLHHSVTGANGDKEGIPTSIMEAMATGLPVVSTRHSGIPELVADGVTGRLVDERDVSAYVDGLEECLEWSLEMGLQARKCVEERFNSELQANALAEIYAEVIRRSEKPLAPAG